MELKKDFLDNKIVDHYTSSPVPNDNMSIKEIISMASQMSIAQNNSNSQNKIAEHESKIRGKIARTFAITTSIVMVVSILSVLFFNLINIVEISKNSDSSYLEFISFIKWVIWFYFSIVIISIIAYYFPKKTTMDKILDILKSIFLKNKET